MYSQNVICENCRSVITLSVKGVRSHPQTKLPPSWKNHPGKSFDEIYDIDPEYIIELANNKSITGQMKEGLLHFLSTKTKENDFELPNT